MRVDSLTSRQAALTGSFSGSFIGDASSATGVVSASYALTASYAENAGGGSGAGFPYSGSAVITGSLLISQSYLAVTGSVEFSYYSTASSAHVQAFQFSKSTGNTTVACLIETSALRYKENIQPLQSQLGKVVQLKPVEFDWTTNKKHSVGFVADEVNDVYPELVAKDDNGEVTGLDYSKMTAILVASIKEQQTQIDNLTQEINKLKNT